MARIKIDLPEHFTFQTRIPIRITDLNYGNHVGNDTVLSIIHEGRVQFLRQFGLAELEFAGVGMIMSDVGIEFKQELFYGDIVIVSVTATSFSRFSFDLFYKLEKETTANNKVLVAAAKTGMVCYDYTKKKIAPVPALAQQKLVEAKVVS